MHWMKEAIAAAREIRRVRKSGITEKLALVAEDEIVDNRQWLAQRDWENQLMQRCIAWMIEGRSPCWFCEECKECKRKEHMKKGCDGWFLRFLTDEEVRKCRARALSPGGESKAGITQGDVEKENEKLFDTLKTTCENVKKEDADSAGE
jgi:hypothetical protein